MFAILAWMPANMQGIAARRPDLGDQPVNTAPSAMFGWVASKALEMIEPSVELVSGMYNNTPRRPREIWRHKKGKNELNLPRE